MDASFSDELWQLLFNEKYIDERQLRQLCLGIPPEKNASNIKDEIDARIIGAIESGAFYAIPYPDDSAAARMYGPKWHIEPAHAVQWAMSLTPEFPKFPKWLADSELANKGRATQKDKRETDDRRTLYEISKLAAAQGWNAPAWKFLEEMKDAAREGKLLVRDPHTDFFIRQCSFYAVASLEDVNAWLKLSGAAWTVAAPELPAPPVVTVGVPGAWATRKELIDAFGKFTGMNMSWFDNLNDSPKLKAARKQAGQGGRHSAEPLFCPYEVMQWLANPKRKKGTPLNDTTAWRLLKTHFSEVYNQYSIGDPNAD